MTTKIGSALDIKGSFLRLQQDVGQLEIWAEHWQMVGVRWCIYGSQVRLESKQKDAQQNVDEQSDLQAHSTLPVANEVDRMVYYCEDGMWHASYVRANNIKVDTLCCNFTKHYFDYTYNVCSSGYHILGRM